MVNNCFTVAVFCVCASIFSLMLKRYCREQSLLISLAACVAIIGRFVAVIQPVLSKISEIFSESGISSEYIYLILKGIAICFITQITSDICRDSEETAIASAAELWGRGMLTVIALPIMETLIDLINDFL